MKVVKTVRKYSPQPIDWSASSVESLVDLTKTKSEPPLTRNLTNRELELMVDDPLKILKYECISQVVERGVKSTTDAASTTIGVDSRVWLQNQKLVLNCGHSILWCLYVY